MKYVTAVFLGRISGSLGKTYPIKDVFYVKDNSMSSLTEEIYKSYECVSRVSVEGVEAV